MDQRQTATLIGELKGAGASIIIALLCCGKPLTRKELITFTRYSGPTIDRALDRLSLLGFTQQEAATKQHYLTTDARQFILGESQGMLSEEFSKALEVKNFYSATSSSSLNHETGLNELPGRTTTSGEVKNFYLDAPAQQAVHILQEGGIATHLASGKGAQDSVEAAIAAGWDGQACLKCVRGWLHHAGTSDGHWIDSPFGFAAHSLRTQNFPPPPKKDPQEDTRRYIRGEYADIIQH